MVQKVKIFLLTLCLRALGPRNFQKIVPDVYVEGTATPGSPLKSCSCSPGTNCSGLWSTATTYSPLKSCSPGTKPTEGLTNQQSLEKYLDMISFDLISWFLIHRHLVVGKLLAWFGSIHVQYMCNTVLWWPPLAHG